MRSALVLLTLVAVLCGSPARAQNGQEAPSLVGRVERAAWEGVGRTIRAFERVGDLDAYADETLDERLRRVRRRAYGAGTGATAASLALETVAALRHQRGDAVPRCTDEAAASAYLSELISFGENLVAVDAAVFTEEEPFDAARLRATLEEVLGPLREVADRHAATPEDVCAAGVPPPPPPPAPGPPPPPPTPAPAPAPTREPDYAP